MTNPKKLIEVAMPIKEISAESVRDKSIRHGHISTLHLWWARRPLPVCRAVVFASLVPDPLDENCPQAFRDAVELLLGKSNNPGDPYHPYLDIPWTSVYDPMDDNLRNRLQMFIGKFTHEMQQHLLHQKPKPAAGNQLSDFSLIKWDNKNNEAIIGKARKLIWVAHNALTGQSTAELLKDFDRHHEAIKAAEATLYSMPDRHLATEAVKVGEAQLQQAIEAFLNKMPKVFDPFAGGGAIPLEAARLGCKTYGNDINPVAHIIQKGSLEFPQKYGKPITYSKTEFLKLYGADEWKKRSNEQLVFQNGEPIAVNIANRLSFDVDFYARKLLTETEREIGHYYPADENGNKPIAYYWARVGTCSNPSCKAEVPLLRGFYLVNTSTKQVHLKPIIKGTSIDFEIHNGSYNEQETSGWLKSANLTCPCCGSFTEVKKLRQQFVSGNNKERLLAVIFDGKFGKEYRIPIKYDIQKNRVLEIEINRPIEQLPIEYTGKFPRPWGLKSWGDLFSTRQLKTLSCFVSSLKLMRDEITLEAAYGKAILSYLAILIDRIAIVNTSFGRWDISRETLVHPFSRQAIQMVFDYPESNPFCSVTGSASNQLEWILRYIDSESENTFQSVLKNASSGDKSQFGEKYVDAVITDPPYYDAIPYADLSDFFYVWLKRTLSDSFPLNFATPQTPKSEECTALKHYHEGSLQNAKQHFEDKLLHIFDAIEQQTSQIISIMFAHQSTEAWTTLCNSILGARMNITGSWAIDTELSNRPLALIKAALASSVTVSCKPSQKIGFGDYKEVKKAIEQTVSKEVELLYGLGFRGADLLTACFGKAVSEFGQYEKVEKADGSEVTVAELLEMARESAFNALLKGFDGDDFTKFYIGWLQLYGFAESEFDDAAKFSRVGLSINVAELFSEHILIKNGNKQTLGTFEERIQANKNLGDRANNFLIDLVHRAMALYKGNNRHALLQYIGKVAAQPESNFWRVVTSLCEVLPAGSKDHEQALGLLTNKDSLIREGKASQPLSFEQTKLF
jgi:adenine-specific DNA methylase